MLILESMKEAHEAPLPPPASSRILFVSRVIPVENSTGARTYVIDLLKYLNGSGCEIELAIIDPSPGRRSPIFQISPLVSKLARTHVRNNFRVGRFLFRYTSFLDFIIAPFGMIYYLFPRKVREKLAAWCYQIINEISGLLAGKALKISNTPLINDSLINQNEIDFVEFRRKMFQPDVVLLNYVWLSPLFDYFKDHDSVLKVILTHDLIHKRIESAKHLNIPWTFSDWNREKESQLLRKADVLLSIHEEDTKMMVKMAPQSEVISTPMSVSRPVLNRKQVPGRCLFVGSNGQPNVQGLTWFLNHVWPLVFQTIPDCSFHVCGTVCNEIKHKYQNVNFLGRVDRLENEYSASELIIIPLFFGSGLKIKLVEALAHGRACVSTSVGVQGLQEFVDNAVLVDDTVDGFAEAVLLVLTNEEKRKMMETFATKHIFEKFSPEKIYRPFLDRISFHTSKTGTG